MAVWVTTGKELFEQQDQRVIASAAQSVATKEAKGKLEALEAECAGAVMTGLTGVS